MDKNKCDNLIILFVSSGYWWFRPYLVASFKLFKCLGQCEQLLGKLISHYFGHSVLNPTITVLDRVYSGTLDLQKFRHHRYSWTGLCRLLEHVRSGGSAFLRVGKAKCIKITLCTNFRVSRYIFVAKKRS